MIKQNKTKKNKKSKKNDGLVIEEPSSDGCSYGLGGLETQEIEKENLQKKKTIFFYPN